MPRQDAGPNRSTYTAPRWPTELLVALPCVLGGCFTADLDPGSSGVFVCEADSACPEGLVCVNRVCESADALPSLEILAPEPQQAFDFASFPEDGTIAVRVRGQLELVPPNATDEHVSGEGHVVVSLDGEQVAVIDQGDLSGGLTIEIPIERRPGAHRITARARRNDDIDYDNQDALAARLFWLDDDNPAVALLYPWPGMSFPVDVTPLEVQIATLNFEVSPAAPGTDKQALRGHTHLHYDQAFPACVQDAGGCDVMYLNIIDQSRNGLAVGDVSLPASAAKSATMTAVLRHVDHEPYFHPFDAAMPTAGMPVFDTIEINRVAGVAIPEPP